jgi:hypothetical protein
VGGVFGTWTEQVVNCGSSDTAPCTASSTIGLGQVRITVPSEFRPITGTVTAISPTGKIWSASYDSGTGIIRAQAASGSDKLGPGQLVNITFSATPAACSTGSKQFITTGLGSLPSSPDGEIFQLVGTQPSVTVSPNGACLTSGGSVTDPATGQTETIEGNFTGHVTVTFGGAGPDCSSEAGFGDLGAQWEVYRLPTQVTITPADDFHAGTEDKISTSEFPLVTPPDGPGGDSSWYLVCFAVPHDAAHPVASRRGETEPRSNRRSVALRGGSESSRVAPTLPHRACPSSSSRLGPTPHRGTRATTWSTSHPDEPGDPYKR